MDSGRAGEGEVSTMPTDYFDDEWPAVENGDQWDDYDDNGGDFAGEEM